MRDARASRALSPSIFFADTPNDALEHSAFSGRQVALFALGVYREQEYRNVVPKMNVNCPEAPSLSFAASSMPHFSRAAGPFDEISGARALCQLCLDRMLVMFREPKALCLGVVMGVQATVCMPSTPLNCPMFLQPYGL